MPGDNLISYVFPARARSRLVNGRTGDPDPDVEPGRSKLVFKLPNGKLWARGDKTLQSGLYEELWAEYETTRKVTWEFFYQESVDNSDQIWSDAYMETWYQEEVNDLCRFVDYLYDHRWLIDPYPVRWLEKSPILITGPSSEFCLYRHFDAEGVLLYVGITNNPPARLCGHRKNSVFWNQVRSSTYEHFSNREELLKAEREAIYRESPRYNKQHNTRQVDLTR